MSATSAAGTAKIRFDGVTKVYDTGMLAVDRVSLDIAAGGFTSLLGPSGCGKSTLLNMIAGFVAPTLGSVTVDGRVITGPGADRGMVFQEYGLFPWRTAAENVAFGPLIQRKSRSEQRKTTQHYLDLVGLAEHASKFPKELSGGMKQRVAIARALANGPSVLLMDEPFGALDAQTRETMQEELLAIWQKERTTVVFVTHSVAEAVFLSDRVVLMGTQPGRIRDTFDIKLLHPRDRMDSAFIEIERSIHRLIREEVQQPGAA
jgi:ABC-type nitrate/sulfonate/bicarbonate transport system ATPase subunit